MLTDDQLAESIGDRLHAEVADIEPAPNLLSTLHRRHGRRMWAVRSVAASSLAVTTGVVALVLAGAGPPSASPTGAGTPTESGARLETVAFITAQTIAALAHSDQFVEKTEWTDNAGSHAVSWFDPAGNRQRYISVIQGKPSSDTAVSTAAGVMTVLTVDHPTQTWWTSRANAAPALPRPKGMVDLSDPDSIRDAIAAGDVKLVGHEQVDGRDTLHVRFDTNATKRQAYSHGEMWVDTASYLPVKSAATSSGFSWTTRYTWLPRTADNLANLDLTPPAGYTHTAGPPNDPPPAGNGRR